MARSSTPVPKSWRRRPAGERQQPAQRVHRLRARDLRRLRGDFQGADDPPHAAHVGHERHPRHHPGRRHSDRRHCPRPVADRPGPGRRHPRHHQRGRRLRRDRPDAGDVQGSRHPRAEREAGARTEEARVTVAAALFIVGLIQLSSPRSARRGNQIAAVGMAIALLATIPLLHFTEAGIVITLIGLLIGIPIGALGARRVKMTAIPQMVALFNGVGGGAAALVAVSELLLQSSHPPFALVFPSVFSIVIGSVSFAGSLIAFAKLQRLMTGTPITYPGQQIVNGVLALAIVALAVYLIAIASTPVIFVPLLILGLVLGVAFVLPIGGADMPVVISMLNAFTGLAVAASGFVLGNFALIVAGTLVGASGTLLTKLMSDAMGRSLGNVLFGAFGAATAGPAGAASA